MATGRWSYYVELDPTRRYSREGVSKVSVTSFIDFWRRLEFAADAAKKTENNCFSATKFHIKKSFFWKLGCVPVLLSLIRILRASLVHIDTEMTKKYSNQRYVVDML